MLHSTHYIIIFGLLITHSQAAEFITVVDKYVIASETTLQITLKYSLSSANTKLICSSNIFNGGSISKSINSGESKTTIEQTSTIYKDISYTVQCTANKIKSNIGLLTVLKFPTLSVCSNTNPIIYSSSITSTNIPMAGYGFSINDEIVCKLCSKFSSHKIIDLSHMPFEFDLSTCDKTSVVMECYRSTVKIFKQQIHLRKPQLIINKLFTDLSKNVKGTFTAEIIPHSDAVVKCTANSTTFDANNFNTLPGTLTSVITITKLLNNIFVLSTMSSTGSFIVQCTADNLLPVQFYFNVVDSFTTTTKGSGVKFSDILKVPCSCDLTKSFCDPQCCCDKDCSAVQKSAFFACIKGPRGGDHSVKISPNCSDLMHTNPWERALCFTISNSAYLGTYYNFVNKRYDRFSFMSQSHWRKTGIIGLPYQTQNKVGSPVVIYTTRAGTGLLALPGRIGRSCQTRVPLTLLQNTYTQCNIPFTPARCDVGSILNVRSYLIPDSPVVDPCKWHSKVYTGGIGSTEALVRVFYKKDNKLINDKITDILTSTDCSFAVTAVVYTVRVKEGTVATVTADITLTDLKTAPVSSVQTSYRTLYQTHPIGSTPALKTSNKRGYELYNMLVIRHGGISVPGSYGGDCKTVPKTSPQFGVSTLAQCDLTITDPKLLTDCKLLYQNILGQYRSYITNSSQVAVTPFSQNKTTVYFNDTLNIATLSDKEFCDNLPTSMHIKVYSKNGTLSGLQITNITYSYHHGVLDIANKKVTIKVYVEYLLSEFSTQDRKSSFTQDMLFNTLIVVFVGAVYFTTPKLHHFNSVMSSKK